MLLLHHSNAQAFLKSAGTQEVETKAALQSLAGMLTAVDTFYNSIGGLVGYQLKCLQILQTEAGNAADADRQDEWLCIDILVCLHCQRDSIHAQTDSFQL